MTGINVLSTGVSASKSKEEGFSTSEKVQLGSDSAAMEFAAILTGWLTQMSGQGQDSGFQSNEPAGKEANSGRKAILGLDGLQALIGTIQGYGNPQEIQAEDVQGTQVPILKGWANGQKGETPIGVNTLEAVLAQIGNFKREAAPSNPRGNIEEVDRAGMPKGQPLGKNSLQSELDLYKGVISELLKEMSGEIKDKTGVSAQSLNTSAYQKLELAAQRMNSGLFTQFTSATPLQAVSESIINPIPSDTSILVDDVLPEKGLLMDATLAKLKAISDTNTNFNSNSNSESIRLSSRKDLARVDQQTLAGLVSEQKAKSENSKGARYLGQENLDSEVLLKQGLAQPRALTNEVKGSVQLSTSEGVLPKEAFTEKGTSQRFSLDETNAQDNVPEGTGILSYTKENIQMHTKVENKADLPIWAQVARNIHEKAFQARPHLRELDIQLHPAELGQIRLSLTWEDGQVHLRVTASELGTGQMLQSNLSELRDNLTQLGIQCGMLEMGLGDQQKNPREQGQEASTQARNNREESQEIQGTHELETLNGAMQEPIEGINRINVTA